MENTMKKSFSVLTVDLRRALGAVEQVIPRVHQLPVCGSVLIECVGRTMRLTGTDIQAWMTGRVELDSEVNASALVNASMLTRAVANAEGERISITFEDKQHRVVLKSGGATVRLVTTGQISDFPSAAPIPSDGVAISLPGKQVARVLRRVAYAAARADVRKFLESVAIQGSGSTLTFVATNGHQLAKTSIALEQPLAAPIDVKLPREMVNAMLRLCEEETVDLRFGKKIYVTAGDYEAQLPTLEGTYVQWRRVIPTAHPFKITVARAPLSAAVKRALSFSISKKSKGIELHFDGSAGRLRISSESDENTIEDELSFVVEKGGDMNLRLGVSAEYLADALEVIDSEEVRMVLRDPIESFGVFDDKDDEWISVIMPMRL